MASHVMHEAGMLNSPKQNISSTILYLVSTSKTPISRTDLASITGLSKMTISNHVARLIEQGILSEKYTESREDYSLGRKPISLTISPQSPCIFGVRISRDSCHSILADISGNIIDTHKTAFPPNMTQDTFIKYLLSTYDMLARRNKRRIIGCGISSIGPISTITNSILNPPNFYNLTNIPVVDIFREHTKLPTYLIHDAAAGALTEKLYGNGIGHDNFVYLHISQGIGAGFILNGRLFNGISGQCGEIGHMSIDCNGPKCDCGGTGCLELYSGLPQMQKKISDMLPFFPASPFHTIKEPGWLDIVSLATKGDSIGVSVLDEFCGYLSYALANTLKMLDFSTLIVGYESHPATDIIERMLYARLSRFPQFFHLNLKILHSYFDGDAPLIGSIAIIANQIFEQNIPLN